jgi:hypothetical protein
VPGERGDTNYNRRFFFSLANQKKELLLAAMFVGRMEPNEEAL